LKRRPADTRAAPATLPGDGTPFKGCASEDTDMNENSITVFRGETTHLKNAVNIKDRLTPEAYDLEVERIFRRGWLPVTSVYNLKENGAYVVVDVPTLKSSLLVVRGQDGVVRAFHNVCRHRGDKLVHSGSGCKRGFTCGFHGWRYSNTGALVGITDETQFPDLDRSKLGLIAVNCEVWNDFVFVNYETTPHMSLQQWLGGIWDQYSGYNDDKEKVAELRLVIRCNWNLATNAFCEGYHNMFIHRSTVPDYQGGTQNPMRHRAYIEVGPRFGRYSAHANMNHHRTPAEEVFYRRGRPLFPSFPVVEPSSLPPGLNPNQFDEWAFDIVHLYPHFVMSPMANQNLYMWFWPVDVDHTEMRIEIYAHKAKNAADRLAQAYSKVRLREVAREDLATMESSHTMNASGAVPFAIYSQQELLIQNHYAISDEMLGWSNMQPDLPLKPQHA